jgi:hypothetical protein
LTPTDDKDKTPIMDDIENTENDEFANAFAELASPSSSAAVAETPPVDTLSAAVATETSVAETPPAAAVETPPVDTLPAAVVTETSVAETPLVDAAAAQIAALQAEIEALKKTPPAAAPAVEAAPKVEPVPVYSADEQALLTEYQKSWPDISAGEALVRRAEYRELVGYIFEQVRQQLTPLQEFTQRQQGRTQYSDLVELVPDYDDVREKTLAWVETQPEYLKRAYKEVTSIGSAADVADLIDRFKKETGYVQTAAKTPAVAAPAVAAALPAAAKAAVAALKVVKSGRTEAAPVVDPGDFDAAFAEFTATK